MVLENVVVVVKPTRVGLLSAPLASVLLCIPRPHLAAPGVLWMTCM